MKAASLNEIKQELQNLPAKELSDLCLKLARYKKENKELLTYLLFESHDADTYTNNIKDSIDEGFKNINTRNLYLAKKTLRKILRQANKYIKYTYSKETEIEVLIHFCVLLKGSGIILHKNKAINNMYEQQLKKIKAALAALHEDIQYDFIKQLEQLQTSN